MTFLHKVNKKRWIEVLIWVAAEVALSFTGLDNIADYGEFILDARAKIGAAQVNVVTFI
ncbi:hypothetical protein IFO70_38510 [Phormidium tenue FACHB-886]|nr:hypothetical protein [Phormidium tenue FACHB-886]